MMALVVIHAFAIVGTFRRGILRLNRVGTLIHSDRNRHDQSYRFLGNGSWRPDRSVVPDQELVDVLGGLA